MLMKEVKICIMFLRRLAILRCSFDLQSMKFRNQHVFDSCMWSGTVVLRNHLAFQFEIFFCNLESSLDTNMWSACELSKVLATYLLSG